MIYQARGLHLLRPAGGLAEQVVEKGSGAVILRSPSADGLRTRAPQKSPRHESGAVATSPAEGEPWFRPRTNRGPTRLRQARRGGQAGKSGPGYTPVESKP